VFITWFLPVPLFVLGVVLSLTGICIAIASALKGESRWVTVSILEMWFLFFTLIVSQALGDAVGQYLPITLLQLIMILFAYELITATLQFRQQFSSAIYAGENAGIDSRLRSSAQTAFRAIASAGTLFVGCYTVSLAVLFASTFAALDVPLVSDISLYIVVVSVSLALLLVLRED
jgi:hypothetical protein